MSTPEEYAQQALGRALSSLPAGANPWGAIRLVLRNELNPGHSNSYILVMYIGSGLFTIVPLLLIASLFVRFKRGAFWILRTHSAGGETYLIPHYSIGWSILVTIMMGLGQGFIWRSIQVAQETVNMDLLYWKLLTWLPAPVAFWLVAWSLAASHSLHLKTTAGKTYGGSRNWPFYTSARFLNMVGVVAPLIYIAHLISFSVIANNAYKHGMRGYLRLNAALAVDQAGWISGDPDVGTLNVRLAEAASFISDWRHLEWWYGATMYSHFAYAVVVVSTLIAVAVAHLLSLRKSMREMKERSSPSALVVAQTMRTLRWVIVMFFVTAIILVSEFLWTACLAGPVLRQRLASQLSSIMPTYTVSIFSLPVAILLLRNALAAPQSSSSTSSTTSKAQASEIHAVKLDYGSPISPRSKTHWEHLQEEAIELGLTMPRPFDPVRMKGGVIQPGVQVTREQVSIVTIHLDDTAELGSKNERPGGW